MLMDDSHGHDVEDTAGVGVFWVRKVLVAPAFVVGCLDILVHLPAIRAFQIEPIFAMRFDGGTDRQVGDLLFRHLPDIERLLVGDVELGPNLRDHVLHGYLHGRRTHAFLSFAGLEFHRAAARHNTLILHCRLGDFRGANLLHQV